MNQHNKALADSLAEQGERRDQSGYVAGGYMEIEYQGESWPLDDVGIDALPEAVIETGREPLEHEKRTALKAQGYQI